MFFNNQNQLTSETRGGNLLGNDPNGEWGAIAAGNYLQAIHFKVQNSKLYIPRVFYLLEKDIGNNNNNSEVPQSVIGAI
jgi:hypothetical protein